MRNIDTAYFREHGHISPEDAQAMHSIFLGKIGATDPDSIVADWNDRDPGAPWGSGKVGVMIEHYSDMVVAFMVDKISEARARREAQ